MGSMRVEARKTLWGNAGNRCAFNECAQRLIVDLDRSERASGPRTGVLGEEAHIRSSKPSGPRYDPDYPSEKLDDYENLVLLCPTHHTLIDKDNGRAWPVIKVLGIKAAHEQRVDAAMDGVGKSRKQVEVALAARIDRWQSAINLEGWEELTYCLNQAYPYIRSAQWRSLTNTATWLAGLAWPPQYPKVTAAFETHRGVLNTLIRHVTDSFVADGDKHVIRRRHKEMWFGGADGEQRYTEAISEFGVDDAVTAVLVAELTRSVNLVMSAVSDEILPLFRFNDGAVQMIQGDFLWGLWSSHPHYDPLVWDALPKKYVLREIKARVRTELRGGDPRSGFTLDVSQFDPSHPTATSDGSGG